MENEKLEIARQFQQINKEDIKEKDIEEEYICTLNGCGRFFLTKKGLFQHKSRSHTLSIRDQFKNDKIGSSIRLKNFTLSPRVSDKLRGISSKYGSIDIEELIEKIIDGKLKSCIETLGGNGKYPCDGFTAVVKNNTIVSII